MDDTLNKNELPEFSKENPFMIPENYFDDFYLRLQSRISKKESFFKRYSVFFKISFSYLSMAVLALALVFMFNKIFYKEKPLNFSKPNNEIILSEVNNISDNDITEFLCDENAKTSTQKVSKDDIIYYLVDNNIDNSEMIDEY